MDNTFEECRLNDRVTYFVFTYGAQSWKEPMTVQFTEKVLDIARKNPDTLYFIVLDTSDLNRTPNNAMEHVHAVLNMDFPKNWRGFLLIPPKSKSKIHKKRIRSIQDSYNKGGGITNIASDTFIPTREVASIEEAVQIMEATTE